MLFGRAAAGLLPALVERSPHTPQRPLIRPHSVDSRRQAPPPRSHQGPPALPTAVATLSSHVQPNPFGGRGVRGAPPPYSPTPRPRRCAAVNTPATKPASGAQWVSQTTGVATAANCSWIW